MEEAKQYRPKKLDEVEADTAPKRIDAPAGVSAWNAAATWEERDLSKWAEAHLKSLLEALPAMDEVPEGSVSIDAKGWTVSHCEAHSVFRRGKKTVGFEVAAKASFHGEYKGEKVSGSVNLPQFDDQEFYDDESYKVDVNTKSQSEAAAVIRRVVQKLVPEVKKTVRQWVNDMKER